MQETPKINPRNKQINGGLDRSIFTSRVAQRRERSASIDGSPAKPVYGKNCRLSSRNAQPAAKPGSPDESAVAVKCSASCLNPAFYELRPEIEGPLTPCRVPERGAAVLAGHRPRAGRVWAVPISTRLSPNCYASPLPAGAKRSRPSTIGAPMRAFDETANGLCVFSAEAIAASRRADELRHFSAAFGLSPAGRSRVIPSSQPDLF
jgi:hypothetical protein